MKQKIESGQKIICLNRKASFNYFFLELLEAGISLKGSEVKSLRDGKGSIADSYAVDNNGEMFGQWWENGDNNDCTYIGQRWENGGIMVGQWWDNNGKMVGQWWDNGGRMVTIMIGPI